MGVTSIMMSIGRVAAAARAIIFPVATFFAVVTKGIRVRVWGRD